MKVQKFFDENPVFRHEAFVAYLESVGTSNTKTREASLAYHVGTGRLVRLRRGLYAVVPRGFDLDPKSYPVDAYLLAGHLAPDAVVSHHSALQFHGRAYSVYNRFTYFTRKPQSPFVFRGQRYLSVATPKALTARDADLFEVTTEHHAGGKVRVTSLERTLVDVLARPSRAGGWEEIWRSLESVGYFDLDKVVEYTLLLESAATAAKVGFFLGQHRQSLMVNETHLDELQKHAPKQPQYLERGRRTPGTLVSPWNLIVPDAIREPTWEETDEPVT